MNKLLSILLIGSILFFAYAVFVLVKDIYEKRNSSDNSANIIRDVPQEISKEPSERSLKVASLIFVYSDKKQQTELIKIWAKGSGDVKDAIRNLAISLDEDPENLALIEATLEVYNQQKNSRGKSFINCTSSTYGNYTYTNCF